MFDKAYYFTDGSIKKNMDGKFGAVAGYIKIAPNGKVSSEAKKVHCNDNIAYVEACAVNMSLEDFIASNYDPSIGCNIYTDSQAVVNDVKHHNSNPSRFSDMMDRVHQNIASANTDVSFYKVKAHTKSVYDQMKYFSQHNHQKIDKETADFINKGNRDVDQVVTGGQYLCIDFYD